MSDKFIPLSVPSIQGNEWKYVKDCLDTGWVSSAGKYVDQFEEKLANYVGVKNAVCCINGTAALHLGLKVCGVGHSDEVLVPTLTFIASINAIKYLGAEPVFMDCDNNYNYDLEKIKLFIENECDVISGECFNIRTRKRIKAIVVVHLFGTPNEMDPLIEFCKQYNIKIIEDACEALGSEYKGKKVGTFGDVACFSFNGNKIITSGAGGALVTNDEELAKKAKYFSQQAKNHPEFYIHNEIGFNYRMSNITAAIGLAQLEILDKFIEIKRKNHKIYTEKLRDSNFKIYSEPSYARSNYWFYCLQLKDKKERDEVYQRLKENNIQTRTAWNLIHLQEPYKKSQSYEIDKAINLWERTLNLPCSVDLTQQDIERVCIIIKGEKHVSNNLDVSKEIKPETTEDKPYSENNKNIIIVGAGCHAKVVYNVLKKLGWNIYGYIDNKPNEDFPEIKYLGDDLEAQNILPQCYNAMIGIGMQLDVRKNLFKKYKEFGFNFPTIISPDAIVAETAKISEGTIVMDGAVIQPFVKIAENCIINTAASIDHDSIIGKNSIISPNATICGSVKISDEVFIGAGATVIQEKNIYSNILVGAGTLVLKDLQEPGVYVGMPAKKKDEFTLKNNQKTPPLKNTIYIIAEAGVNHNGDINLAKQLIDAAAESGVDAVKFQTFKTEFLVTESADQAEYQKNVAKSDSQFSMLKGLELTEENFLELKNYCKQKNIDFLSTPHSDKWSVDVLEKLNVSCYKLGSGDLTNIPFLKYVASKNKPIIISTGMANINEVNEAKESISKINNKNITILHCTTSYPCPENLVNLRAMNTIKKVTDCEVGYSDHTLGLETSAIATALGAKIYEKHFTLNKNLPGPDHQASLNPEELKKMVKIIRLVSRSNIGDPLEAIRKVNLELDYNLDESKIEIILGSSEKAPQEVELQVAKVARKSIVALRDIAEGEVLNEDNIGVKRPGVGLHPRLYDRMLSRKTRREIKKDFYITWEDLA